MTVFDDHGTADDDALAGKIAVIGMAGRFPGAADIDEFWANLRAGVESVRRLEEDELLAAGVPLDDLRDPTYVPASAVLEGVDQFDAAFFGLSPRDAAVFDPQHRLFLECAWHAFEHAGYVGERYDGAVGVFAACGLSEYMFKNVLANARVRQSVGEWLIRHTGNDTNFLATRVSYELNLRGPSMNVQTACSSSLVAIHLACQSLLSGECDMALAGGSVVSPFQHRGYFYKEGEILSPDGHCRAFDAKSAGTIISSASACVLLKPLADAVEDGDNVLAVILGSAINNDGNAKVGYLAPSVSGQARVVTEALGVSGVDARDVSYVETHGTGTLIGDPIEIAGLTEAYRQSTADTEFCAIGSLKSNIGHTGEAAGVASMIKTVLALQHHEIPPSLHFESPNPAAGLPESPFFVNAALRPWKADAGRPRIAGVTALGAGGTNAHVLVEEWDDVRPSSPSRAAQLITVSARTPGALDRACRDLAEYLREHPDVDLADVAYTRLVGRKAFRSRRAVVASTAERAAEALTSADARVAPTNHHPAESPSVVFMIPGGGAQYPGMGRDLYDREPVYRAAFDACAAVVAPELGDLAQLVFADDPGAQARLERPSLSLPALFATSYATAALLESLGITPAAMIGHSAGEYVAACRAGVISMEDGMRLVALRGRLFETVPKGAMLSVSLAPDAAAARMPAGLSIAATNAPELCVVSGPIGLIEAFAAELAGDDIDTARVRIDIAAHSSMLDAILGEFGAFCRTIRFAAPTVPYVSNLTGTWATAADVTDPDYWVRHLRGTVRFADGLATILSDPDRVLFEVGPGRTLSAFARLATGPAGTVTPTIRHPQEPASDVDTLLGALGRAWAGGLELDPARLFAGEQRRRVTLPTYPFEHQRYWVDPDPITAGGRGTGELRRRHDVAEWFSTPAWRQSPVPRGESSAAGATTLIVHDGDASATDLGARLRAAGAPVVTARLAERFQRVDSATFELSPARGADWLELVDHLESTGQLPDRIVHVTAVGPSRGRRPLRRHADPLTALDATMARDQASLVFLAQALSRLSHPIRLLVVTTGAQPVAGERELHPERALLHGATRVVPRELGHVAASVVDLDPAASGAALLDPIVAELDAAPADELAVYRNGARWVRDFGAVGLDPTTTPVWRPDGVYLITGGFGGIGLTLAEHIAHAAPGATLVLLGRTELPDRADWERALADPGTDPATRTRITAAQRLVAAGADVIAATADVADRAALAQVIADVRRRKGAITGVVHSAGILRDALIALRTPHATSPVVEIKARGAVLLDELLGDAPPEVVVYCSSVSSILGLPGQVDYTAANNFLDAYAVARDRAGATRYVSVDWSAWQEVGMAVGAATAVERKADFPHAHSPESAVHLFDDATELGDAVMLSGHFSRERHWLLDEHVVAGGDALIPGTGYLELMRQAAVRSAGATGPVELRDVFFLAPFAVATGEERVLHVKAEHDNASITVFSDAESLPHATARIGSAPAGARPQVDLADVRARCTERSERFDGYSRQAFMQFGPRWGNLQQIDYGTAEALVSVALPARFAQEPATLWLHPALLDMATGGAQALVPGFSETDTFYVPFSYERVSVHAPLPSPAYSHVRLRETSVRDLAVFDISICDADGSVAVDVGGFTMRLVEGGPALTDRRTATSAPRAAEPPINLALREGILPAEGADALDRILSAGLSGQVVASSLDLDAWRAHVDREASGTPDDGESQAPQFGRPELSSEFEPAATPIERELAAMWQELLGIEQVGRNDDFFELGGQSLVAVRLFNRIRKRYSVDLPLATLFEARTIPPGAAVGAAMTGVTDVASDTSGASEPAAPAASRQAPAFRSLVTIQKGGDRIPFFCVHGSGGNVLNFRDLSMAMGRSQPFYGLQARGIDGVLEPHGSIEEMAAAYLEEIRGVQPQGPYALGGYSGGGLVAFEMAHQLVAAGERVAVVLLLDTFPPVIPDAGHGIADRWRQLRADPRAYLKNIVGHRLFERRYWNDVRRLDEIIGRGEVVPVDLREKYVERNFATIAERYVLRRYRGRVILIRAADLHFSRRALGLTYGWDAVVEDGFELLQATGNHENLVLEPNAARVAELFRRVIDSASTGPSQPTPA